ncbi:TIGR03086 family metal-binding protein [Streptomyces similanensis]|uniref:TIGR03086 family metal-binding protein n=1 Tax=Streptomyces similanensis TaxID=1274988 RepID=A0ABP9K387_9ACTN
MDSTTPLPDPRPVYARATEQAAAVIAAVRPEQLAGPTPCREFDVRALLDHVVVVSLRLAAVGADGVPRAVDTATDGVPDDGWSAAYEEVRTRVIRAWESDERMAAPTRVPWGEMPGRAALSGFVMELVAHTWDLNEALGRPLVLDPELGEFALAAAHRALPEPERDPRRPFDAARPAPEGADANDRLAAWLGRRPLDRV